MKFINPRNLKIVAILLIFLTLISLTFAQEQDSLMNRMNRCKIRNEHQIKEQIRDDYTKKIIFFIFLTYFYTNFF